MALYWNDIKNHIIGNRKLIIFGTGSVGKHFSMNMGVRPVRYLDNDEKKSGKTFLGVPILCPKKMNRWQDYFIVIAVNAFDDISHQLIGYGLKDGKDFIHYSKILKDPRKWSELENEIERSLEYLKKNVVNMRYKNIFISNMALSSTRLDFLNELYQNFGYNSLLLVSETYDICLKEKENKVRFPYFLLPEILRWNFSIPTSKYKIDEDFRAKIEHVNGKKYLMEAKETLYDMRTELDPDSASNVIYSYDMYFRSFFSILSPEKVFLWNPFCPLHYIAEYIAKERGIIVEYAEQGPLPGTFVIDKCGHVGESSFVIENKKFSKQPIMKEEMKEAKKIWKFLRESKLNRKVQPNNDLLNKAKEKIKNGRPILFYAGQKDNEAGLLPYTMRSKMYHSPVFVSSIDALIFLADIVKRRDWNLLYKPHPLYLEKLERIPDNVLLVEQCDINDIIDFSDVTITILSQTGYISMIRKKPTVMLGYNQLKGTGCTYEAFTKESVEEQINNALLKGFTNEQEINFLRHIAQLCKYVFDDNSDRSIRYGRRVINNMQIDL